MGLTAARLASGSDSSEIGGGSEGGDGDEIGL